LLAFDLISEAVAYIGSLKPAKDLHYSITTNGSLLDAEILDFLARYSFTVIVSFDGLAQEKSRQPGTFDKVTRAIKTLAATPAVSLRTNYVVLPETVDHLADSIKYSAEIGIPDILLTFSTHHAWDKPTQSRLRQELLSLRPFLTTTFRETGAIPLRNFRHHEQKGIFSCNGGCDRMALDQDGLLWGCYLAAEYFKGKEGSPKFERYCFGYLDDFISDHEQIWEEKAEHYSSLRQYACYTSRVPCSFCDDLEVCRICPFSAALATSVIGKIPDWRCTLQRIVRDERDMFLRETDILPAD